MKEERREQRGNGEDGGHLEGKDREDGKERKWNRNKHGSRESQEKWRWKQSRLKENQDGNEEAEMNGLNLTAERRNENCRRERGRGMEKREGQEGALCKILWRERWSEGGKNKYLKREKKAKKQTRNH